jgi:glycolate oxidase FAD binding subunit
VTDPRRRKDPGQGVAVASGAIMDSEATAARLTAFLADLRGEAEKAEGALTVREGLTRLSLGFDAWGPIGSSVQIMRRIKERFDPQRVLNPGRFVGGI